LKGGYLPRPGVAFAAEDTISTSTRCTYYAAAQIKVTEVSIIGSRKNYTNTH
jgi:hypothetical protein